MGSVGAYFNTLNEQQKRLVQAINAYAKAIPEISIIPRIDRKE